MNCVCKNFGSLIAVRVLLGCFESAVAPAYDARIVQDESH